MGDACDNCRLTWNPRPIGLAFGLDANGQKDFDGDAAGLGHPDSFILLGQPSIADPSRAPAGAHTV